jgi:hypothetical protein
MIALIIETTAATLGVGEIRINLLDIFDLIADICDILKKLLVSKLHLANIASISKKDEVYLILFSVYNQNTL